jgi:hypothetical protein
MFRYDSSSWPISTSQMLPNIQHNPPYSRSTFTPCDYAHLKWRHCNYRKHSLLLMHPSLTTRSKNFSWRNPTYSLCTHQWPYAEIYMVRVVLIKRHLVYTWVIWCVFPSRSILWFVGIVQSRWRCSWYELYIHGTNVLSNSCASRHVRLLMLTHSHREISLTVAITVWKHSHCSWH